MVIMFLPGVECSECTAWGGLGVGLDAAIVILIPIPLFAERQSNDSEVCEISSLEESVNALLVRTTLTFRVGSLVGLAMAYCN